MHHRRLHNTTRPMLPILLRGLMLISLGWMVVFTLPAYAISLNQQTDVHIKGDAILTNQNHQETPWWDKGTGQLPYESDGFTLGNAVANLHWEGESSLLFDVNLEASTQSQYPIGITEAWLTWRPLPINGYRVRVRAGSFYPSFSLENTDVAWTSPYTQSFSFINTWFGEELKTYGTEVSMTRPGRFFQSNHSVTGVLGVYAGNDAIGTIISWRGFALHNNQTHIGERVNFAPYPSIEAGGLIEKQPAWVDPTPELDGRLGYYAGGHWQDRKGNEVRAYYYDNLADPLVLKHGQYAWHTRFTSLAGRYVINKQVHLVSQWISGRTEMGANAVVVDFDAWFALLNWQPNKDQFSFRYDQYTTQDVDGIPSDNNNGDGKAVTLAWQRPLSEHISVGLEATHLKSTQYSRESLGINAQQTATSVIGRVIYRW